MPGDYIFPKRLFKDGEPLSTYELNEALQPVAERLNGHLGPHNIRAPLSQDVAAEAGTFYRTVTRVVDVDPQMTSASGGIDGKSPQPGVPGAFMLEQETGWQPVTGGDEDMIVEMVTGASALTVTAHAAHCFAGGYGGVGAEFEVQVPLFEEPQLKSDGRPIHPALLAVTVRLNGLNYLINKLEIPDARLYTSAHSQSVEIARRIVAAGPAASSAGIAAQGWIAVTGHKASYNGRMLTFTQQTPAVVSTTVTDFQLIYGSQTGPFISDFANMTQVKEPIVTATALPFSDLDSCDPVGSPMEPTVVKYFPAQIQYAIRVDGVVLTDSITGRFDNEQAPFAPARVLSPRDANVVTGAPGVTGPQVGRFRERPDGINIPMYTVRLTATINVEPGDHRTELVVRRVPTGRRRSFVPPPPEVGAPDADETYLPQENRVFIYSRQLAVTDVPIEPVGSSPFGDPVTVAAFNEEDVVSKKALVDLRMQPVADGTNAIESFQVARGAITGDHLQSYSSVIGVAEQGPFNNSATVDTVNDNYQYPGGTALSFSADPFAGLELYPHTSNPNWRELQTATFSATVGALSPPQDCVITIEANIFLEQLAQASATLTQTSATPAQDEMHLAAACFVIGLFTTYSAAPGWYLFRPSLSWVNSNNYIAHQVSKGTKELFPLGADVGLHYLSHYGPQGSVSVVRGDEPGDFVDIPLTAQLNFSGKSPAGVRRGLIREITKVGIFTTAAWMGSASNLPAKFRVRQASINAVAMKS